MTEVHWDHSRLTKRHRGVPGDTWVRVVGGVWHLVDAVSACSVEAGCGEKVTTAVVTWRSQRRQYGPVAVPLKPSDRPEFGQWRAGHWPDEESCRDCITIVRTTRQRIDNRWRP